MVSTSVSSLGLFPLDNFDKTSVSLLRLLLLLSFLRSQFCLLAKLEKLEPGEDNG